MPLGFKAPATQGRGRSQVLTWATCVETERPYAAGPCSRACQPAAGADCTLTALPSLLLGGYPPPALALPTSGP